MAASHLRRTLADDEHEARLESNGFAVIPFASPSQIEALQAIHDRLGAAPDDPGVALYFGHQSKSVEHKRSVSDALRAVVSDRVREVFADHEMYLTMFITKWPGGNSGFGPHQDPTLVDERTYRGVTIWIPLTNTGVVDGRDNGMLHVVPGSHRFVQGPRVRDVNESVFAGVEEDIVSRFGVGVPTTCGEAIVFDNRTIHYSMPNETDQPRIVVSLGMRPQESACVYLRHDGRGGIEQFAVTDDWFIDVNAAGVHLWEPDSPPTAVLDPITETMDSQRFAELCAATDPAPGTVPGHLPASSGAAAVNPGTFCAYCGTSEGLESQDRAGRGKAQFLCETCALELHEGFAPAPAAIPETVDVAPPDPGDGPMRVLLIGASPSGSEADERLRKTMVEVLEDPKRTLAVAWLLDGPGRERWEEVASTQLVVDDLRTWPVAEHLEHISKGVAARTRGLRLRTQLRRLGTFDAVVLHQGMGERILRQLPRRPAVVAGLWNSDEDTEASADDHPRAAFDVVLVEEGTTPPTGGPVLHFRSGDATSTDVLDALRGRRSVRA